MKFHLVVYPASGAVNQYRVREEARVEPHSRTIFCFDMEPIEAATPSRTAPPPLADIRGHDLTIKLLVALMAKATPEQIAEAAAEVRGIEIIPGEI
jgi:hypothetical protein